MNLSTKKELKKEYEKQRYQDNKEKINKRNKQWAKDNPEKQRIYNFKKLYGISHEDWLEMWESQDGKCAICGKQFQTPFNARVDHNHRTGEVRGLLCHRCNVGLGYIEDMGYNIKATEYLASGNIS